VEWKDEHTIALIPIGLAIVVSVLVLVVGGSPGTAQWAAVIAFFGSLPFVIGRLIDRAR
jgi:membrane associated rhomboid family serine protease